MATVTELLQRTSGGDEEAEQQLISVLYVRLKEIARARMRREPEGHTLNTTGLVHEAYMRLVDTDRVEWTDRNHFMAVASRTMRRVLIDHARKLAAQKRQRVAVVHGEEAPLVESGPETMLLDLNPALDRLGVEHPRQSRAVELVYFGGLTQEEAGATLGISQPTVARDLRFARAWLGKELDGL